MSQTYLSEIERGIRSPGQRVVLALSKALQMPAHELRALAGYAAVEGAPAANEGDLLMLYRTARPDLQRRAYLVLKALLAEDEATAAA